MSLLHSLTLLTSYLLHTDTQALIVHSNKGKNTHRKKSVCFEKELHTQDCKNLPIESVHMQYYESPSN